MFSKASIKGFFAGVAIYFILSTILSLLNIESQLIKLAIVVMIGILLYIIYIVNRKKIS